MKTEEFYRKYANLPLDLRFIPISFKEGGKTTLSDCYKRINELESQMNPLRSEEEKLLNLAELVLSKTK